MTIEAIKPHPKRAASVRITPAMNAHLRRAATLPIQRILLPRRFRPAVTAVTTFYRETRMLGAGAASPESAARLAVWEADVRRAMSGTDAASPLLAPLKQSGVPLEPLLSLIAAQRMRQQTYKYATYDDLLAYCAVAANPLGRLVLTMMDCDDAESIALSDALCTALLLTSFWRDIARDYMRGRVYVPQEDMDLFSVSEEEIAEAIVEKRAEPNLRALVAFEVERTESLLRHGASLLTHLHGRMRLDCRLLIADGNAMLTTIARQGYDPFVTRPMLSRFARAGSVVGAIRGMGR